MKTIATTLLCLLAVNAALAASLNWGIDEGSFLYVSEDGTSLDTADKFTGDTSGWMFCLVYCGTSEALDISTVSDANVVDTFEYGWVEDGGDIYADPFTKRFDTTGSATALNGDSITISTSDHFGIAFYNGSDYLAVMSTDGSSLGEALTSTTQFASLTQNAQPIYHYIGGGAPVAVSAVPEPSVAILGLLGLGMLIKRRKA